MKKARKKSVYKKKANNYLRLIGLGIVSVIVYFLLSIIGSQFSFSPKIPTSFLFPDQTTWVEPWDSLSAIQSRWDVVGTPCFSIAERGILDMLCQSAGLKSKQVWDKNYQIKVVGTVKGQPSIGSATNAYWGGLTLYNNNGSDTNYGELAVEAGVSPFQEDIVSRVVSLTDNNSSNLLATVPWTWYNFTIIYSPKTNGSYMYYVNNRLVKTVTNAPLQGNPDIFIVCESVVAGSPSDDSHAHCQFGPITVTGKPL